MRWSLQFLRDLALKRVSHHLARHSLDLARWDPGFALPLFSLGCVETRLGAGENRVDFSACIAAEGEARRAIGFRAASGDWPPSTAWARCRALLRDWSDPSSPLFRDSNCLWFEFDLDAEVDGLAEPFGIVRLRHPSELKSALVRDDRGLASRISECLLGRPLPRSTRELIRRCQAALPERARFLHVAAMPHREHSPVRLIVSIPMQAIPRYAKGVGWPGSAPALEALVARLAPFPTRTSLHLDLEEGVGPRLGLDLYRPSSPLEDPSWKVLFDVLESEGACAEHQRSALSTWPPSAVERNAPSALGLTRELAIKVVVTPGSAAQAKSYLAFGPRMRLV